jgi:DAK2 domain fusion protein YloV
MATSMNLLSCDGLLLKQLTGAGLGWLNYNRETVNQMNVFPVPDGDTGTNMSLTMRKAYDQVALLNDKHVGHVSGGIAQGALMGARGNSGVILSQWWRGFARGLEGHEVFDSALFAQACRVAVEMAYKAVVEPVEGTILTVSRRAMEAVQEHARAKQDLTLLFEAKVEAGYDAVRHTPDQLPILKKAGVVDSGGLGLVYIFEGMLRFLRGEDIPTLEQAAATTAAAWQDALEPEDAEGYGYDVQFLMRGRDMDVAVVRSAISNIGWSTLVVGNSDLIKVHVHVHDPGVPLSYAIGQGAALDDVVVENMQKQYETYVEKRIARETEEMHKIETVGVVAVVAGQGLARLYTDELQAAHVIEGGQTMNPSTEDFLAAVHAVSNKQIILLPNNKNVILAAEQAASLAQDKQVRVVPSRTIPQGISAMIAYHNLPDARELSTVVEAMKAALNAVLSCEVTRATRNAEIGDVVVREGQYIGLLNGDLVVAGYDMVDLVRDLLRKAGAGEHELVTVYYGDGIHTTQAQALMDVLAVDFPHLEFEIVDGGQPLYPYLISIE